MTNSTIIVNFLLKIILTDDFTDDFELTPVFYMPKMENCTCADGFSREIMLRRVCHRSL